MTFELRVGSWIRTGTCSRGIGTFRRRALALAVAGFVCLPAALAASQERAIWVWEESARALLNDPDARMDGITFLTDHGISTVYLYADRYGGAIPIDAEPEKYARLIRGLHAVEIRVHALLRSADLRTREHGEADRGDAAERTLGGILTYNARRPPEERFDGIHLDIEPYTGRRWESNRKAAAREYLDLSAAFLSLRESRGASIPIGAAMPFWYDGLKVRWNGRRKRLNRHVQDLYDYVAIMAYRDFARGKDGIIAHATPELKYADRIGRRVVVGVNTGRSSSGPEKTTFHEEGLRRMEIELGKADREFRKHASFGGFAIHHYATYRDLVDGRRARTR